MLVVSCTVRDGDEEYGQGRLSAVTGTKGWQEGQEVVLIAGQPLKLASVVAVKPSGSQQQSFTLC